MAVLQRLKARRDSSHNFFRAGIPNNERTGSSQEENDSSHVPAAWYGGGWPPTLFIFILDRLGQSDRDLGKDATP